jgi:hypothetical protein
MLGAPVSLGNWWAWNQIPVTIGNIVSGALFTGLALHATHAAKPKPPAAEPLYLQGHAAEPVLVSRG